MKRRHSLKETMFVTPMRWNAYVPAKSIYGRGKWSSIGSWLL